MICWNRISPPSLNPPASSIGSWHVSKPTNSSFIVLHQGDGKESRKRAGSHSIRAMEREREDDAVIKEEFEVGADEIDEFEVNGGISREKIVSAESMTRDEACVEMEFTDHDFYVFKDSERDDILCVIYRREAGGYGVLAVLETV